jgi:hypothetical protein
MCMHMCMHMYMSHVMPHLVASWATHRTTPWLGMR